MSRPSSEPSADSPSLQRSENDGLPDSAEHDGHESAGGMNEPLDSPVPAGDDHDGAAARADVMFPFDENIFYSEPPPLETETRTEDVPDSEPFDEDLEHPAEFKPFFTLIEDPETGAYHHPRVHYLFSDDDPEILTNAVLDSFDDAGNNSQSENLWNAPHERYIIVDVAADGKTVATVSSLSLQWQAMKASFSLAPTWANDSSDADRGLMLKISGQQNLKRPGLKEERQRTIRSTSMEDMLEAFHERLARLDNALATK